MPNRVNDVLISQGGSRETDGSAVEVDSSQHQSSPHAQGSASQAKVLENTQLKIVIVGTFVLHPVLLSG